MKTRRPVPQVIISERDVSARKLQVTTTSGKVGRLLPAVHHQPFWSAMTRIRMFAAVTAFTACASSVAVAQTCVGLPDLTVTRANLGANAQFANNTNSYVGRVGVNSNSVFGGLSVGYIPADGADDASATTFGGDLGLERHVGTTRRVHVCPIVTLDYQNGPNIGPFRASALAAGLSAAFGMSVPVTPTVSFVPFVRAGLLSVRARVEVSGEGESESATETGGQLGFGASLRFNDIFALTPSIIIPVGFDGSGTLFSIGATVGFRRR